MPNQTDHLTKPAMQRLEAWMMEITDCLCYQPEIPMAHKTELVNALKAFQREINPVAAKSSCNESQPAPN